MNTPVTFTAREFCDPSAFGRTRSRSLPRGFVEVRDASSAPELVGQELRRQDRHRVRAGDLPPSSARTGQEEQHLDAVKGPWGTVGQEHAQEMADVIFNGSTRRSLGMAEVTITFDNTNGIVNVATDEGNYPPRLP